MVGEANRTFHGAIDEQRLLSVEFFLIVRERLMLAGSVTGPAKKGCGVGRLARFSGFQRLSAVVSLPVGLRPSRAGHNQTIGTFRKIISQANELL